MRHDKTTDAYVERQGLHWNAWIISKWDRDGWFVNQLAQQICMPYVQLEREGFCQEYKISDELSKWSKDSLRKTPNLRRCAPASHIEGKLSSICFAIKFISTTGRKQRSPKWLVSWKRRLFQDMMFQCCLKKSLMRWLLLS